MLYSLRSLKVGGFRWEEKGGESGRNRVRENHNQKMFFIKSIFNKTEKQNIHI